jgi:hypothetical protein
VALLAAGGAVQAQSDALDASLPPLVRNSNGARKGAYIPPPSFNNVSGGARTNRVSSDTADSLFAPPDPMRNPDRFADTPQIDADGVRHFANGKHFDLKTVSLDEAIDVTNSSTLGTVKRKKAKANQSGSPFGNPYHNQIQFGPTYGVQNLQQNDMDQARQLRKQQRRDERRRARMNQQ